MTDTIESLRAQHAELGRRIEALEREEKDVGYFTIFSDGSIGEITSSQPIPLDERRAACGNRYRTEAEARRGALAAQAMRKLRLWADEDKAANPGLAPSYRCYTVCGEDWVGPIFATSDACNRAQAALTKEELEALA